MLTLGPWQTNCYLVWVGDGPGCWIVDAGFEPQPLFDAIEREGLEPTQVILTHAHVDHIGGLAEVRSGWPEIPILIHAAERGFCGDPEQNLSAWMPPEIRAPEPTGTLAPGQVLRLDGVGFEVRHTPGHSPGGITLYQPQTAAAIVGDTLFNGSIGRYDFPHSDGPTLLRSIRDELLSLPEETTVYPGHGPTTHIGDERRHNPFVRDAGF